VRRPRFGHYGPCRKLADELAGPAGIELQADDDTSAVFILRLDPLADGCIAGDIEVEVDASFGEEEEVSQDVGFPYGDWFRRMTVRKSWSLS
jgi:hypothetical protein